MDPSCFHENSRVLTIIVEEVSLTVTVCPYCKCFLSDSGSAPLPFDEILHQDPKPYITDAQPTRPQLVSLLAELAKEAIWDTPSKFKSKDP